MTMTGLAVGFATGNFLTTKIRHQISASEPAVAESRAGKSVAAINNLKQMREATLASTPVVAVADLSALLKEDNSYRRLRELASYVDRLWPEDIPGVIEQVESGHGPGRDNLLKVLAGRWVEVDPQGALAAARKKGARDSVDNFYDAFYGTWANRDAAGAIAAIQQLPDGHERGEAIWAVLYQIADNDPVQAQELFKSVHTSNLGSGNHFIYSQWAEKDLDHATQALLQNANFSKQGASSDALEGIADHLLEKDPGLAVAWLAQLPAGKIHDEAQKRVMEQWARTDPKADMDWVKTFSDLNKKDDAIQTVMFQWADQEPRAAIGYAVTLPEDHLKAFLVDRCLACWANADGPAALSWAQNLPSSANKNETVLKVINIWAGVDPASAADGLRLVSQEQLSMNPRDSTSDRTPGEETYADVARAWAKADPARAEIWLNQLPTGYCRNAAVKSYSEQILSSDPVQAVQVAESITDAGDRDKQLVTLLTKWMKADPNAAAIAVQGSPLSDDRKKQLLGSMTK